MGREFGVGNLAFPLGRQISHAKSRGFLLCPPIPLCFACPMSHPLSLASAKFPSANFTTAQLTSPPPPPPPSVSYRHVHPPASPLHAPRTDPCVPLLRRDRPPCARCPTGTACPGLRGRPKRPAPSTARSPPANRRRAAATATAARKTAVRMRGTWYAPEPLTWVCGFGEWQGRLCTRGRVPFLQLLLHNAILHAVLFCGNRLSLGADGLYAPPAVFHVRPTNFFEPLLRLLLQHPRQVRLGLGSPSWWNQSWFYNPF